MSWAEGYKIHWAEKVETSFAFLHTTTSNLLQRKPQEHAKSQIFDLIILPLVNDKSPTWCPWAPRTIKEIELFCSFATVLNGNTNIVSCSNVILVLPLGGVPCTGFVQETTKKKTVVEHDLWELWLLSLHFFLWDFYDILILCESLLCVFHVVTLSDRNVDWHTAGEEHAILTDAKIVL